MPKEKPRSPPSRPTFTEGIGDLRFYLAEERTLLAWVRTALSLIALGFVIARFALFLAELPLTHAARGDGATHHHPGPFTGEFSLWMGVLLILAGVLLCVIAAIDHVRFRRRFLAGLPYEIPRIPAALFLADFLVALGTVMAVYLAVFAYL